MKAGGEKLLGGERKIKDKGRYFIRGSFPLPLMLKGEINQERNIKSVETRGEVITRGV